MSGRRVMSDCSIEAQYRPPLRQANLTQKSAGHRPNLRINLTRQRSAVD